MDATTRGKLIIHILFEELLPILEAKGADYSGQDVMSNFRDFGLIGLIARIGDKYHRLKNIVLSQKVHVKNETIEDTIKDLINYGFITLLYLREEANVKRVDRENSEYSVPI